MMRIGEFTAVAWRRLLAVWAVALALNAGGARPALSATSTVTDFGDTGAPGQLRTLINAAAPGDTIIIPAGIITLITFDIEDANATGDLDIYQNLIVQGAGAGSTIIDGGRGDRVIDIFAFATVNISNMTIRNGGFGSAGGGGIRNAGTLTLTNVAVSDNIGGLGFGTIGLQNMTGGGILNSGTMTLTNCTVSSNTTVFGRGGGIANAGTMTLTNVVLNANTVNGDQGGGGIANTGMLTLTNGSISSNLGGGIFNGGTFQSLTDCCIVITPVSGTLLLSNVAISNNIEGGIFNFAGSATLTDVTISGNTAFSGIRNDDTMTLTNVTVSDNTSTGNFGFGGGILNIGTLTLANVTVTGNIADQSGGGIANLVVVTGSQSGGAVVSQVSASTLTMTNVTVTGNTPGGLVNGGTTTIKNTIVAKQLAGGDCANSATLTSNGFNLDSDGTCHLTQPSDKPNVSIPLLGPLQNNGGPTQTHALLPGSPAIDAGTNTGCPAADQRGVARPQGTTCDIGAFEFGVIVAAVQLNGSAFHTGQQIIYEASLNPSFTPTQVDIYLGVLLPDGVTFLSFVPGPGGTIAFAFGPVPVPFVANVTLTPTVVPFAYTFTGTEPIGTYFTYAGVAVAGSDPLQAANQLSVGVQAFQFSP